MSRCDRHPAYEADYCPGCGTDADILGNREVPECGAVYVTNTLGGMDVCVRPTGHDGGHDWRKEVRS